MGSCKLSFSLLLFLNLTICHIVCAQNSRQNYINAHNAARGRVGIRGMVWNTSLAAYARNYAARRMRDCNLVHSGGPCGENLAKGIGTLTGTAAVNLWVVEKSYYDYHTNTCAYGHECGHYTQVVWRGSVQLGCARARCANNRWSFVICNYYPPGNYLGQTPY